MSTSADPGPVRLRAVPYDHPVARTLVGRVQQEYVARYGGPDEAVVDPAEFRPPAGLFLVAEVGGVPAGCGAWRVHADGVVEVKRVYVDPAFRRRGLAQLLMAELERSAAAAGHRAVVLNSGNRQPEALALYAALGYTPVAGYGVYADAPGAVFLGKGLTRADGEEPAWATATRGS
ncbi:GNAT family N-acetyltransferase [Geodermatophilus sabuli]|uniref:Acetyltransferase (GNAT) family protein n=1 Tax=Geodermatophilus sabuli TaxID=1564158 RepID=A0A285EII7_9ACTN|nr:GNAT family N-acetyltransferase [Geodermatophilus sabuli]MBB3085840.1 GNAT superfamily N-acetyltransferase [Geodermatophilus sabuli]SNX98949.1 Acetyltransferase (GNAT) family protein [Geodermatophilus sabuli]